MINALRKMIEAVEAGTLDARACGEYGHFLVPCCNGKTITLVTPLDAYHGSVDAAIALCEALLPGWEFKIGLTNSVVFLRTHKGSDPTASGASEVTSRALLLAVLRAKLMEMENE